MSRMGGALAVAAVVVMLATGAALRASMRWAARCWMGARASRSPGPR
jgi:hypothetical protein